MTGSLSSSATSSANSTTVTSVAWPKLLEAADKMPLKGPDWWQHQAKNLRARWVQSGLPTTRLENWKYTSLKALSSSARQVAEGPVDVKAPAGVLVTRLSEMSDVVPQLRKLLEVTTETGADVFFDNMARSFASDPFVIQVPAGFSSDIPIELQWRSLPDGRWSFGVAAILIGAGADVAIVEKYGYGVDAQTVSTLLEVGPRAHVAHLRLQTGNSGAVVGSVRARVLADAKYETSQISFGSNLSREDLTVELCEKNAQVVTDGLFIGRQQQLLDHHTNLVHVVGDTTSRQIYKGILSDESRGVFNGRIAIAKNATGSNSAQMNKNLLLSKKVELDTKPQLEIDNDDVKAAHGAAIGRLDPDHIFYLRSRGISLDGSVAMLAKGFAAESIARLDSEKLRTLGLVAIEKGLSGLSWEGV